MNLNPMVGCLNRIGIPKPLVPRSNALNCNVIHLFGTKKISKSQSKMDLCQMREFQCVNHNCVLTINVLTIFVC